MATRVERSMTVENLEYSKERIRPLLKEERVELCEGTLSTVDVCALSSMLVSGEYPNVKALVLKNNKLRDSAIGTLIAALNYNSTITELDLGENDISQRGVYHLLLSLTSLNETLLKLNLEYNTRICSGGVRYIAEILENNSSLIELNLNGIELDKSIQVLANGLKTNDVIRKLSLESTGLSSHGLSIFFQALTEEEACCKLEMLNLSFNPIRDRKYNVYVPLLSHHKFSSLKVLYLSFIQLMYSSSKRFSKIISDNLAKNITLEELHMQGNLLADLDCLNMSKLLQGEHASGLKKLNLSDNCIAIDGARSVLFDVQRNFDLLELTLDENKFIDQEGGDEILDQIEAHLAHNRGEPYICKPRSKPKTESEVENPEEKQLQKLKSSKNVKKRDSPPEYGENTIEGATKKAAKKLLGKNRKQKEEEEIEENGEVIPEEVDEEEPDTTFADNIDDGYVTVLYKTGGNVKKFSFFDQDSVDDEADHAHKKVAEQIKMALKKRIDTERTPIIELSFDECDLLKELSTHYFDSSECAAVGVASGLPFRQIEPSTEVKQTTKKTGKRNFVKKLDKIAKLKNQLGQKGALPTLSESILEQRKIKHDLSKAARLVTFELKFQEQLRSVDTSGFHTMLPSAFLDELLGVFEEADTVMPDIVMLESFTESLRLVNAIVWCVVQMLTGVKLDEKQAAACSRLLSEFANVKASSECNQTGIAIMKGVIHEMIDALILLKPLYAYAETLLLVVKNERSYVQPRLSFYEKRDAKLEAQAERHITKKLVKVEQAHKANNLRKKLMKVKEGKAAKMNHDSESTTKEKGVNSKNLEKVLKGVKQVHKVGHMKRQRSANASLKSGSLKRKEKKRQLKVSQTLIKFRDNCPERVEDVLDDLRVEANSLSKILSVRSFLPFLVSFLDSKVLVQRIEERVTGVQNNVRGWFDELQSEFHSDVLEHSLSEILGEIREGLGLFRKADLAGTMKEIPLDSQRASRGSSRALVRTNSSRSITSMKSTMSQSSVSSFFGKFGGKLNMTSRRKNKKGKPKTVTSFRKVKKSMSSLKVQSTFSEQPVQPVLRKKEEIVFDEALLTDLFGSEEAPKETLTIVKKASAELLKLGRQGGDLDVAARLFILSTKVCQETVSMRLLKVTEKFGNSYQ